MTVVDIIVIVAAVAAIAALGWFFFGPRRAHTAQLDDGVQRVAVTVRGGYSPNVIQVRQGVPVEMVFDRQESGDCTSHVVIPDLQLSAATPAYERTTVRFTPKKAGSFAFGCAMNMIHGTLLVEPGAEPVPPDSHEHPAGQAASLEAAASPAAVDVEAAQAQERHAEIADLPAQRLNLRDSPVIARG